MLVVCTGCSSKIRVPDTAAGKRVKCPKCQTVVQVPLTEEPAAPPPPPPVEAVDDPFADMGEAPAPAPVRAADDTDDAPPPRRRSRRDEDAADDDLAAPPPAAGSDKKNLSMAALICGIVGIVCCGCTPLSIAAIVLGVTAPKSEPAGKQMAMIGLILGCVGLVLQCGGGISYYFFVPNIAFPH